MKHRPTFWGIRTNGYVELYDINPLDADAVRLADMRAEDWDRLFCVDLPEGVPQMLRSGTRKGLQIARNK